MARINCPDCSKSISAKAESCPNCGYPISRQVKIIEIEKEHSRKEVHQIRNTVTLIDILVLISIPFVLAFIFGLIIFLLEEGLKRLP
jgi:hypothetical protein